jgi:serine protease Do
MMVVLTLIVTPEASARPAPESFADTVEKLTPAVVNISTTQKIKGRVGMPEMEIPEFPPGSPFEQFREFFEQYGQQEGPMGAPQEQKVFSLGSGFVIDSKGLIVTNNHVVADADEVTVTFSDNTKLRAKIIGRDEKTDLALLSVKPDKPLTAVRFGDSDAVRVGDWVIAIGNPFGLGGTVTAGIISARARNINAGPFDDFLQTDAAINRGNSGGPMFNVNGEVVGINTAIFSPSGGSIGIGFAVPSALARPVIEQLKEFGRTRRGWLGVKIQVVTDEVAESIGFGAPRGALVAEVTPGSPAAKTDIQPGDIIVSFDGKPITEMRQLPRIVAETPIGKTATLTVWRNGNQRNVQVTVGELDESAPKEANAEESNEEPESTVSGVETYMGLSLAPLDKSLRTRLKLSGSAEGLAVVDVDPESAAAERDFSYGDVLVEANGRKLDSVQTLKNLVEAAKSAGRKHVLVQVLRGGSEVLFVTLPVKKKAE